jgi:hypothetical protein
LRAGTAAAPNCSTRLSIATQLDCLLRTTKKGGGREKQARRGLYLKKNVLKKRSTNTDAKLTIARELHMHVHAHAHAHVHVGMRNA